MDQEVINELKRCTCILRLLSEFISRYVSRIFDANGECAPLIAVLELVKEICGYRQYLLSEAVLRIFHDNVLSGISLILQMLIDNSDETVPEVVLDHVGSMANEGSSIKDYYTKLSVLSSLIDCLSTQSSPTKSHWLKLGVIRCVFDTFCQISQVSGKSDIDTTNTNFSGDLYKELLINCSCLLITQANSDIHQIEQFMFKTLLDDKIPVSVWNFCCDQLVFVCRYGPVTLTKQLCQALCDTLASLKCPGQADPSLYKYVNCSSHWRMGFLLNRLLKLLKVSDNRILLSSQRISIWCYFPWDHLANKSPLDTIMLPSNHGEFSGASEPKKPLIYVANQVVLTAIDDLVAMLLENDSRCRLESQLFCVLLFLVRFPFDFSSLFPLWTSLLKPIISELRKHGTCTDVIMMSLMDEFDQRFDGDRFDVTNQKAEESLGSMKTEECDQIVSILSEIENKSTHLNSLINSDNQNLYKSRIQKIIDSFIMFI